MFFVNPGVRVSRRNRVPKSRVLSVLFRRLTGADCRQLRMGSRFYEAEFPLARLIVYRVLLFLQSGNTTGSPARDCASNDALRPFNNWVKPEDQYGILSTWEKRPAFARRLPQTGGQSLPPPERAYARSGKKIASPAIHGPFLRRRGQARTETGATRAAAADPRQWRGAELPAFA
ncbi:MAG: hypothetical protein QOG12_1096 [Verrucomicrobiota bacterium]